MSLERAARLAARAIWAIRTPCERTPWQEHRLVALDADGSAVVAAAAKDTIPTPVGDAIWVQIATAGRYLGHAAGEFTLDASVFSQVVDNFRKHPSYVRGANGLGAAFVVPFDWRHASERAPSEGGPTAPLVQAAQGWALDLEMRSGLEDGKLQLWALAVILEPMKTLVEEKKVLWTSIAIWPNSPDPVTGANMGWYLSSIAFTNDPFIQGMQPIAADRANGALLGGSRFYLDPYAPPGKPSEVLEALRRIFGLAELAGLTEVLGQLATLRAAALGQVAAPAGVDIAELVGALRILFNLPTLSPVEQVFGESDKLVAALAEELESSKARAQPAAPTTATAPRTEANPMNELLLLLCSALGIVGAPTEAVVMAECKRRRLDAPGALKFVLDRTGGDKGSDGDAVTASAKIKALLGAAGVEDVDGATSQLVQRCADVKNLMSMVPELEQMMAEASDSDDEESMEDVRTAMRVHHNLVDWEPTKMTRLQKDIASVMLAHRTGHLDLAAKLPKVDSGKPIDTAKFLAAVQDVRSALKARKLARENFHKEYLSEPEQPVALGDHYLLQRMTGGSSASSPALALARVQAGQPAQFGRGAPHITDAPGTNTADKPEVDLELYQGNRSQRLLAAARQVMGEKNFEALDAPAQFAAARSLGVKLTTQGVDLTRYDVVEA